MSLSRYFRFGLLAGFLLFSVSPALLYSEPVPGYPPEIQVIHYPVKADKTKRPSLFWKPENSAESRPLLVALHTWSGDYLQAGSEAVYARWCLDNDWVFIHPNFRGPNRTPEAMGSDLMIADIESAVTWAKKNAAIDESRIYAIGVSGGGHAAQLIAGRMPDTWAAVSAWCGISDIAAWHRETSEAGRKKYTQDIENALGGNPNADDPTARKALHRSPVHWLKAAKNVPLDLNHGIHDGRNGSVPFTHSLQAWNAVVSEDQQFTKDWISKFYNTQKPPSDIEPTPDPLFGRKQPIFRKVHQNTRITIFDGGHEIIHLAALNWLAAQRKGEPVNWNPPKSAEIKTSNRESESGK